MGECLTFENLKNSIIKYPWRKQFDLELFGDEKIQLYGKLLQINNRKNKFIQHHGIPYLCFMANIRNMAAWKAVSIKFKGDREKLMYCVQLAKDSVEFDKNIANHLDTLA